MILGSIGCFTMSIVDDMDTIARKEKGQLGFVVRYRFQQLSAFDTIHMGYKKESKIYDSPK